MAHSPGSGSADLGAFYKAACLHTFIQTELPHPRCDAVTGTVLIDWLFTECFGLELCLETRTQ